MINVIKEEIEEEEISEYDKKSVENNNINNKIMSSSKGGNESSINMSNIKIDKNPEKNNSEYSEDLLPKIYSKYKYKFAPTKKRVLITSSNINLNEEDDEKRTILHRACLQIKLGIIRDLEPKLTTTYVNKLDKYGNNPLILACKNSTNESKDREEILEILIKHGANVHCIEPINGWTALHWCCYNGDLDSVKLLIKYGSNFFLPSKFGYFTIDLAGKRLFYNLVSYIIKTTSQYLQKIGDYELLNIDNLLFENISIGNINQILKNEINRDKLISTKKTLYLGKIGNFRSKTTQEDKLNIFNRRVVSGNVNQEKTNIFIDLSQLPKINQTIYLRLFTEHCLYWACYFNYKETIINMFLSLYNARPAFPLFCLDNRTSLHAACTQGSLIPFQLVYKTYEIKRKKKLNQDIKSEKNNYRK